MKTTAPRQRGYSDFQSHYNAIRHQLKFVFITTSLLSIAILYTLNLLAGVYGRQ
jgi:hypothetical protein